MTDRFDNLESLRPELVQLVEELIPTINDDYRADEECDEPSMELTVATDNLGSCFAFQTGDNSYTGACYSLPYWAVTCLTRESVATEIADDLIEQLADNLWYVEEYSKGA